MSDLLETFDSGVLTLTINRPHAHNTIDASLSAAIMNALRSSADDPEVRCITLTGSGNIFCAGGDVRDQESGAILDAHADPQAAHSALVKTLRDGMEVCGMLHRVPKPTLAVISGAAAGAGLALALACDLRFCLDTAKLTTAFSKVGLSGDSGLSYFLPRLVGSAKARELCFTAEVITGRQAHEIGLVNKVASAGTFDEEARAYAEHLAALPTVALGLMKENLNAAEHRTLNEIFDLEAENIVRSMSTEDHRRAAAAFVKKEPVVFEGR